MNSPRARRRVVEAPSRPPPAELRALRIVVEPDLDPDLSDLDPATRTLCESGVIQLCGVRAEADVLIRGTEQTLASTGTWSVEPGEYLDEVARHEWAQLRDVLKTVGVPTDQLPLEVDPEQIDWRT
jgi:hypothetical protein